MVDVRTVPRSRTNPQFNEDALAHSLKTADIAYVFLGRELGARSDDPACYEQGRVHYGRLAKTALFQAAEAGRADVVRYLLEHGASVDVRDDAGRTPGAVARSKEIAALLPPAAGISR